MSAHQGSLVMLSLILLLRSVLSYYQDNSLENEIEEFDDLPSDTAADGNIPWKTNYNLYSSYPENTKDPKNVLLLKDDPELYLVTSLNRKHSNAVSACIWYFIFYKSSFFSLDPF